MLAESFKERRSPGFWKSMWPGHGYEQVKCPHQHTKLPDQGENQEDTDIESLLEIRAPVSHDAAKSLPQP
jgi:hypothetical protein